MSIRLVFRSSGNGHPVVNHGCETHTFCAADRIQERGSSACHPLLNNPIAGITSIMATVLESLSSSESTTSSVYRSAEPVVSFAEAESLAGQFGTPFLVASRTMLMTNY